MDRQAFPSIILSVSIVCFFAVALYERDKVPRAAAKGESAKKSAPARDRVARSPTPPAPGLRAATDRSKPTSQGREASHGLARSSISPDGGRSERTAIAAAPGAAPSPGIRMVSKRTTEAAPSRAPSRAGAASGGKLARAPFTVVGTGETIADVARRIYGTTEDAGVLWRANRDVLRDPDSPIAPGTVLRTPAAPLR